VLGVGACGEGKGCKCVSKHEISHTAYVLAHGNIVVLATNSSLRSHGVCRKINSITVIYNILFNNITFHRGLRAG